MDEYVDFVEASLRDCDPARVARQKDLEERIRTPFRIGEDTPNEPLPAAPAVDVDLRSRSSSVCAGESRPARRTPHA